MARRRNHHLKSNESASSLRSATAAAATLASSKQTNNNHTNSHSNNNTNKTCVLSNESRTSFKLNGIRVPSEEEEEEEEAEEEDESEEEEAGGGGAEEDDDDDEVPPQPPDNVPDDDAAADDDDDADNGSEHVRSNNNNSNNKRKRINRRRRKRLGRPPQSLSMDDISMVPVSNGSGGGVSLTNGHHQTYECPTCHVLVESASEFTRHIRQHNAVDTAASNAHSCSLCGKVLSSASSLDRHMLVHSGERPFKCSRCEMAFTTNGNMHRHMRTHHDNGNHSSLSPSLINSNVDGDDDTNNNNNSNSSGSRKSRGVPVKRKLQPPPDGSSRRGASGGGRRNLWTKRSRQSQVENDGEEDVDGAGGGDDGVEEEVAANSDDGEMIIDNSSEDLTIRCPLCNKGFLCKSGLRRHLEGHPEEDLTCKDCGDNFDTWQNLLKHLCAVHQTGVKAATVILGADGGSAILLNNNNNSINNNNNNNNKAVDMGFHDLTFVDFSTDKFTLIAKSACERHVRRPSSAHHAFQCSHCWKAFPSISSLKMHSKSSHGLVNGKSKSSSSTPSPPPPPPSLSTPQPPSSTTVNTTCRVCHAAFAYPRQLEIHSLRHQNTEHCATPCSRNTSRDNRQEAHEQQHIVDPATADLAPDINPNIDKESFLALLELQSKHDDDHSDQDDDDDVPSTNKSSTKRNNKSPRVTDIQPNDFADIQTILAVTSSTTMNIIPSMMMMGSSPGVTRPSSSRSSESPTSPRLADSVTASPELPSPNQNQSTTMSEPGQTAIEAANNQNGTVDGDKEVPNDVESITEAVPSISINNNLLSNSVVVDLSSATGSAQNTSVPETSAVRNTSSVPVECPALFVFPRNHDSIHVQYCNRQKQQQQQQQQILPDETDSLRSLINLTNCTVFDPPQEQPLDLVLQPIDLTVSNSKKGSTSSADNCSPSSASSSTASSSSSTSLPIDLSAPTRQRSSSAINLRMSPLMTSTPTNRRIPSLLVSPVPIQPIPTQQQQQPQNPTLFETSSSSFANRFTAAVLTESSYVTANNSNVGQPTQRFIQDGVRRPIAVQPTPSTSHQHPVISNVADNVVPLTLVPRNASHHSPHVSNSLKSTSLKHVGGPSTSSSSLSSGFSLKRPKQKRYRTERPYKCVYCGSGFTLRSNMERHIKQQHPERWSAKSRRKGDPSQPSTSSSPSLPLPPPPLPQPRLIHPVPNVAFPSIPPPQNVIEYNPVLAAAANNSLAHSRPPLVLARSPSPPSVTLRLSAPPSVASSSNKSSGTISKELRQAISNQIKQKKSVEVPCGSSSSASSLASSSNSSIPYGVRVPPTIEAVGEPVASSSSSVGHLQAGDNNVSGRLMGGGNVRHIWRPAPQMEAANRTPVVEDGGDLASVSELLDRANQQSIQDLFRKRGRDDEDDDDNNDEDNNSGGGSTGHRTEESEEDQPLASLKSRDQSNEVHSKTPERSRDGRKSAYGNAPNRVACPYCYRQFPWTSSLRRHVLTHTGQKPFKCPKCPLWFTTKSNCDRHLSRKHGGGSGGGSSSSVQSDVSEGVEGPSTSTAISSNVSPALNGGSSADCTARNAPDRPYRCHHCLSSTFSTPGNLQKHMMTKHPNQLSTTNTSSSGIRTGNQTTSTVVSSATTTTSTVQGDRGGESSSGSERCWGGESEESGEDLMINETGQQDEALFVCFVCLKSFAERGHCLQHLRERHPDEHGFLNNAAADNGLTSTAANDVSSALQDEAKSSSPESLDRCSHDDDEEP